MGADYFESHEEIISNAKNGIPKIGIGDNCEIRNAIIDNDARIGNGVKLINVRHVVEEQAENYVSRDGIIVIPINTIIPDGTII